MIIYKTKDEIELIRQSSLLVSNTLAYIASLLRPGISTLELDKKAEQFILDNDAKPSFKGYKGFPFSLCISINENVVHGFPSKYELMDGDVVSVDCGVYKQNYHGDSAYTFLIGEASIEAQKLCIATKYALAKAIDQAVIGNRVGDISSAVQYYTETMYGYGVVRDLVGHGIGKNLHEEPEIPNFGTKGRGPKLLEGLVIAIEPMINLGTKDVVQEKDGWTIRTRDRKIAVHFEHNVAISIGVPDVLSSFEPIESAEKQNINLVQQNIGI